MNPKPQFLVVEDNEVDVRYLRAMLAKAGISTITHAWDGNEAVRHLRALADRCNEGMAAKHLVLLLDLDVPILNGFEILKFLEDLTALRDMKVFVLTSNDDAASRERAARAGVSGYLLKPLSLAQLSYILETTIDPNAGPESRQHFPTRA